MNLIIRKNLVLALFLTVNCIIFNLSPAWSHSAYSLSSPSKNLEVKIQPNGKSMQLMLFTGGKYLLNARTLHFELDRNVIEGSWHVTNIRETESNHTWKPVYGERSLITDRYRELQLFVESTGNKKKVVLTVRLYDEGLAFRYEFDKSDFWNKTLNEEKTQFQFEKNYPTWVTERALGEYCQTTLNALQNVNDRPQVIKINDHQYIAVGEAALVDYARMKITKSDSSQGIQSQLSGKVQLAMANYHSPWRYVMIADHPGALVQNNYFILNLNEPNQIRHTDWIRPGKVIREVTLTTEGSLAAVDWAAQHHIEYVEFDAGWYGPENDPKSDATTVAVDPKRSKGSLDLHKVIQYATSKGVGIIVYVNMKALHNQLNEILPLYQKWGIKGVKFGFVDVGDQYSTVWLHHAVREAAKYELMVDIHDECRPTGYSRTYPNLMTQEGIRGDEESPALNQTIYTLYNRMICGAGDYTNCYFANRVIDKMGGRVAQLAKLIAIYSPWQFIYWYDRPGKAPSRKGGAGSEEAIIKEDAITNFYCSIPTVWDETRSLNGEMGEYAAIARRSGTDWYVSVLNAEKARKITLNLNMLKNRNDYKVILYYQHPNNKKDVVSIKEIDLRKDNSITLNIDANSGCVLYLHSSDHSLLPRISDTVYVSPVGQDSGDGTEQNPFYSLNRALHGRLDKNTTDTLFVQVASGDYYQDSPLILNSSSERPVVIKSVGNEKPRFIGGMKIGGWQKYSDKIYRAYIPQVLNGGLSFEQFYVNGHKATLARTPNVDWYFVKDSKEYPFVKGIRSVDYAVQKLTFEPEELQSLKNLSAKKQSDLKLRFYHKWDITQKHVEHIDVDSGCIYIQGKGMKSWNPVSKGSRYIMYNYPEALDSPGEWYLDKEEGYLYYMPCEGENMDKAFCIAPLLHQFIIMKGNPGQAVKNIRLDNISFQYSSYTMPQNGDEPMQAAATKEAAMMFDFVENISFVDCEVLHTGSYGIWFRRECHNNRIEKCYITDLGSGGIKLGEPYWRNDHRQVTSGNVIHNNIITHAGTELPCGVGVAIFHSSDNHVTHNEISDLRYSGISIGWVWGYNNSPNLWTSIINEQGIVGDLQAKIASPAVRNIVEYNHIHHIGWGELSDMGAVYTLGESLGTRVSHNVIHDIWSYDYGGWGLYTDEGSTGVEITYNLVYRCKSGGFHQHYGKENKIENNIFAFGHYYQVQYTRVEPHTSFSFKRNIILQDEGETLSGPWETGNIDMDYNLYWHLTGQPSFGEHTWNEWQKMKEPHSVIADPHFKDVRNNNFEFVSTKSARRIGFKNFDFSKAGVYGSDGWIKKAQLDDVILDAFNKATMTRLKK